MLVKGIECVSAYLTILMPFVLESSEESYLSLAIYTNTD